MQFQDDLAAGVTLVRPALQSPDYVTGVSGWAVKVDGSAEFNDVVIRGGTTTQGQVFVYDGAPAVGNMLLSISPTAGADAFGNAYPKGQGLYGANGVITFFDALGNDEITINSTAGIFMVGSAGNNSQLTPTGQLHLGTAAFANRASVFAGATGLHLVSPSDASGTTDAETRLILAPGDSDGTPRATAQLGVITSATDTDFTVLGTVISDPLNGTTPAFIADLPSGTTADLLDLRVNGATLAQVSSTGALTAQNMEWGTAQTPAPGVGGGTSTVSVVFGHTFPTTPRVTVTAASTVDPGVVTIREVVDNESTTGFDIRAFRSTNSATNFRWHALGD